MIKDHKIGLASAIIISMNGMIGGGIFSVPVKLIAQAGPAGLLTYTLVSVAVWFIALALSRTAQAWPEEGSFYMYARQWGGHSMGMIAAGSYIVGLMIALGLLTGMAGIYMHTYIPTLPASLLSFIIILLVTLINITGLRIAQLGQYVLICCTVIPIIITILFCLIHADIKNLTPFMPFGAFNVITASKAVIFGFFGFECAASLFSIIQDPEKNVPKALTYSLVAVSCLYISFVGALILAVPLSSFQEAALLNAPLTSVLIPLFKQYPSMLSIINCSITTAIIGVLYAMTFACGKLLASLSARSTNKRFHLTSSTAILVIGLGTLLTFMTLSNADLFFSLTALFILTAFILSIIALLVHKKHIVMSSLALFTAAVLFVCAAHGLWVELNKVFILHYVNSSCKKTQ